MDDLLIFEDRTEFREWLKANGETSDGIWLAFGKTESLKTLSAEEALEEALCFGWIDGLINSLDEHKYKKYFSRRRKRSNWSDKNKRLAEKLINKGIMTGTGMQAVEDAKRSGEWERVQDRSISDIQRKEFESLIEKYDPAYHNYCKMAESTKKQFTGFYFEAIREDTRLKRLEKIVALLEQGRKLM